MILVTGGAGYIGSHTVVDLIQNGFNVVIADNMDNASEAALVGIKEITGVEVPFEFGDISDFTFLSNIFDKYPIKSIVHFAAHKAVNESVEYPLKYYKNNLFGLISLLEIGEHRGVKDFVFSSSCSVYGNITKLPVNEDTPLAPVESPYARTKIIGEEIILDLAKVSNCRFTILRYFNPGGAHPSGMIGESSRNQATNLIPVICETAAGKRSNMVVYGTDYPTRDGSCIRDFIHVMDIANAHTLAIQVSQKSSLKIGPQIFNLGIGGGVTVLEAIAAFEKRCNTKLNYLLGPRREGDVVAIFADYSQAEALLGWKPKYNIEDIMHTAWQWELNKRF